MFARLSREISQIVLSVSPIASVMTRRSPFVSEFWLATHTPHTRASAYTDLSGVCCVRCSFRSAAFTVWSMIPQILGSLLEPLQVLDFLAACVFFLILLSVFPQTV